MTTRLTQKHWLKGVQALEIDGADLKIRRKPPFRPAVQTRIPLAALGPEPLLSPACVSFASRASGQVLVSLAIGRPDARTFNEFLGELRTRVSVATGADAGNGGAPDFEARASALNGNVQDAPPEFAVDDGAATIRIRQAVKRDELEQAIGMLRRHLDEASIEPFIEALEDLLSDPADQARLDEVARRFAGLGIGQGAVLTYAPYLGFLLSDHPFAD